MGEIENRYDRQERIEGWNQSKLQNAKVAIVGAGHIGNYLASSLAAVGVGDIRIYDDEKIDYKNKEYCQREFLLSRAVKGASKAEELEKKVREINPLVDVFGMHMSLDSVTQNLIEKPNVMVIASNNKKIIDSYRSYASSNKINLYVAGGDENGVFFSRVAAKERIPDYDGAEQEAINSEIIAGLLSGEIVWGLMGKEPLDFIGYDPQDKLPKGKKINLKPLKNKNALVVGAGALGNFLGLGLSHANLGKVYLVDDDTIEITNLNRQIMFHDAVGKYKADVLAERIMAINPDVKFEPLKKRVTEDFEDEIKKIKPDILIDCVDNLSTRAILNHFALRYEIPLISGGTDFQKGQLVVYQQGKSACLNCRLGVDKALVEARRASSCIHAPIPSVVITNHIIGGLMAAETRCVLAPEDYGDSVMSLVKYDSTKNARIGLVGTEEPCNCKRKGTAEKWIKELTKEAA